MREALQIVLDDHPPRGSPPKRNLKLPKTHPPSAGKAGFEVWVLTKGSSQCATLQTVPYSTSRAWGGTLKPRVRACIGMVRSLAAELHFLGGKLKVVNER